MKKWSELKASRFSPEKIREMNAFAEREVRQLRRQRWEQRFNVLAAVVAVALAFGIFGGAAYVMIHFLAKVW